MTKYLIVIILFALSLNSYCQVNLTRISNEFCECFDEANKTSSTGNHELILKKCIDQKKADYENDLKKLLDTPENQIEFIKILGGNCVAFIEYYTKHISGEQNLSDKEYTENIYLILDYFSSSSEKGKLPKTVSLASFEAGILYNIFLNKVYPDSIYREGFNIIQPHDSIIIFNIRQQHELISLDLLTKDSMKITIEETLWFAPKPDSIGVIYKNIGFSYVQRFIIPVIRSATREVFSQYTSSELYRIDKEKISNLILSNVHSLLETRDYVDFNLLKVENIEFPHILNQAKSEDLLGAYYLLKSNDKKIRKKGLDELFNKRTETAYLIIITHWSTEKDQEILDYILKRLVEK